LRERFYFRDLCAALFTVKRRCIVDRLPLHARKDLVRTFHRETNRCLLDEIGKPDRASRAGGDLSGMKIEEEYSDVARKRLDAKFPSFLRREETPRVFFHALFHPRDFFLDRAIRYATSRRTPRIAGTYVCVYVIRRAFYTPRDSNRNTNAGDTLTRCD